MLASLQKEDNGYIARFDRPLKHSAQKTWSALTENAQLEKWMANLQIKELQKGGIILFDMKDGSGQFIDLKITEFQPYSVLEFNWGNDRVRFEIIPESDGCTLVLKEYISTLNDHTSKDLSGWHVCLDVLSALLDGHEIEFPMDQWQEWHKRYAETVRQLQR